MIWGRFHFLPTRQLYKQFYLSTSFSEGHLFQISGIAVLVRCHSKSVVYIYWYIHFRLNTQSRISLFSDTVFGALHRVDCGGSKTSPLPDVSPPTSPSRVSPLFSSSNLVVSPPSIPWSFRPHPYPSRFAPIPFSP